MPLPDSDTASKPAARRPPGFRFSVTDGVAIAICGLLVFALDPLPPVLRWLPVYVLGHFFLFCNVVRMRRRYELVWAVSFVVWFAAQTVFGEPVSAWQAFGPPAILTTFLTALELRSPTYRGVGWSVLRRS